MGWQSTAAVLRACQSFTLQAVPRHCEHTSNHIINYYDMCELLEHRLLTCQLAASSSKVPAQPFHHEQHAPSVEPLPLLMLVLQQLLLVLVHGLALLCCCCTGSIVPCCGC